MYNPSETHPRSYQTPAHPSVYYQRGEEEGGRKGINNKKPIFLLSEGGLVVKGGGGVIGYTWGLYVCTFTKQIHSSILIHP